MNKFLDNTGLSTIFQIVKEWLNGLQSDIVGVLNGMNEAIQEKVDKDGVKTINGESILGAGNIEIQGGTEIEPLTEADIRKYLVNTFIEGTFLSNSNEEDRYIWINGEQTFFNDVAFKVAVSELNSIYGKSSYERMFSSKIETISSFPPLADSISSLNNMFYGCYSLKSVNLSNWNTDNVTDMGGMFNNCYSLKTLNLSNLNTTNLNKIGDAFFQCTSLQSLDLSGWNMENVSNFTASFFSCSELKDISGPIYNIKVDLDLSYSPLTKESAEMIIDGLVDVGTTRTLKLKSGVSTSSEKIAEANAKGWTVTKVKNMF